MKAVLVVGAVALSLSLVSGCSAAPPHPRETYGGVPQYLRKAAATSDRVLVGTAARPALTIEGDSVDVAIGSTLVRASVVGPEVPGEGLPYQALSTTCTWTVTLTARHGSVAISRGDFSALDHLGNVYHPEFVPGQPAPPAVLAAGGSATFELRSVMTVGEGLMRWAPSGGPILSSWDFEVEND